MKIEFEIGDSISRLSFIESSPLRITAFTPEGPMVKAERPSRYPKEPFLIPWHEVKVESNYVRLYAVVLNPECGQCGTDPLMAP